MKPKRSEKRHDPKRKPDNGEMLPVCRESKRAYSHRTEKRTDASSNQQEKREATGDR